jgi:hypothetical protein
MLPSFRTKLRKLVAESVSKYQRVAFSWRSHRGASWQLTTYRPSRVDAAVAGTFAAVLELV